ARPQVLDPPDAYVDVRPLHAREVVGALTAPRTVVVDRLEPQTVRGLLEPVDALPLRTVRVVEQGHAIALDDEAPLRREARHLVMQEPGAVPEHDRTDPGVDPVRGTAETSEGQTDACAPDVAQGQHAKVRPVAHRSRGRGRRRGPVRG